MESCFLGLKQPDNISQNDGFKEEAEGRHQPHVSAEQGFTSFVLCSSCSHPSSSSLHLAGSCQLMKAAGNRNNLTEVGIQEDIRAVVVSARGCRLGEGFQTKEGEKEHQQHSYTKERLG